MMQAHRVEVTIKQNGTLTLEDLPFHTGEVVEVIVLARSASTPHADCYPLRGEAIRYIAPAEPVAYDEWEAER